MPRLKFSILILSIVFLTSCSPTTAPPAVNLPADANAFPFSALPISEMNALADLVDKAQQQCYEKLGFPARPVEESRPGSSLEITPQKFGVTDEAQARRQGMEWGPVEYPIPQRPSLEEGEALDKCRQQVMAKLPVAQELETATTQMLNDATAAYHNAMEPTYAANNKKLAACAEKKGWKPAKSTGAFDGRMKLEEYFGVKIAEFVRNQGKMTYTPLPEEVDLAVTLATCRRELKVYENSVTEVRKAQQAYVDKNATQLIELRDRLNAAIRQGQQVLA